MSKPKPWRFQVNIDNPGDYSQKIGDDLYLNPFWALNFQSQKARVFCDTMIEILGPPDLWCDGFWKLLWGPRHLDISWRPQLYANLSGKNGQLWTKLHLPWRSSYKPFHPTIYGDPIGHHGLPKAFSAQHPDAFGCEILDVNLDPKVDFKGLKDYAKLLGKSTEEIDKSLIRVVLS